MTKTRWQPKPDELITEIAAARTYYQQKAKELTVRSIASEIGISHSLVHDAFSGKGFSDETYDKLWEGSIDKAKGTYDIVIANIIADVLKFIAKDLKFACKENGRLILSGILDKKESLVKEAFSDLTLCTALFMVILLLKNRLFKITGSTIINGK